MLLTRNENEGVVDALYESSNIVASTYNKNTNQLKLIFKNATEYIYEGVDIMDYHKLELADSQGSAFHKYLKSYAFIKGDSVDIDALKKRIKTAKQDDINEITKHVAELAKLVSDDYDETGDIKEATLSDLIRLINIRKEKKGLNE